MTQRQCSFIYVYRKLHLQSISIASSIVSLRPHRHGCYSKQLIGKSTILYQILFILYAVHYAVYLLCFIINNGGNMLISFYYAGSRLQQPTLSLWETGNLLLNQQNEILLTSVQEKLVAEITLLVNAKYIQTTPALTTYLSFATTLRFKAYVTRSSASTIQKSTVFNCLRLLLLAQTTPSPYRQISWATRVWQISTSIASAIIWSLIL